MTVTVRQIAVSNETQIVPQNDVAPTVGGNPSSGGSLVVTPGDWTVGTPPGGSVQVLGNYYIPSTAGLNDSQGWQSGSYESRVYEEGQFALQFANEAGSDGLQHLDRFGILAQPGGGPLYRPGFEFIEVYDDGTLLYVGTPTRGKPSRSQVQIEGYDPFYLLRKTREYYAGYWNHAPRDVWEHYTSVWRVYLAEDFSDKSPYPSSASSGTQITADGRIEYQNVRKGPVPGQVRIDPGSTATTGHIAAAPGSPGEFVCGWDSSNPDRFNYWQVRAMFTRPRFGSETVAPYGDNAFVRVGLRSAGNQYVSIQLQEKVSYMFGPNDVPGGPSTAKVNCLFQTNPGSWEVIVEGRERWIYFFVNQSFVGSFPMPQGPTTVQPFVSVRTGDTTSTQYADIDSLTVRRCQPFLMRDATYKGTYRLPSPPAPGGLWGRYYSDYNIHASDDYARQVYSPHHTDPYGSRLDKQLNFTSDAGGISDTLIEPNASWMYPGLTDDRWWSVRWTGSIYLDLANTDIHIQSRTLQEGARVWVAKTRFGEQIIDNWYQNLGTNQTSGSMRSHIGVNPDTGSYESGWYPILIEYGQRGTHGAAFGLFWDVGGSYDFVPSDMLSPYGIVYDQMRAQSHYDALRSLAETWGYQMAVEPRTLESGSFPGILRPRVRVGADTDKILGDTDLQDYSAVVDADDVADAILGDGSGLAAADSQVSQMTAEGMNFSVVEGQPMLLTEYEQWGDITFAPMLAQRVNSLLALRSSAWEEVAAQPPGFPEMRDTFPVTGMLSMLYWTAGDGIRLNLPRLGVIDATPRQILGVTRPFIQLGLKAPSLSFRQRPRNIKDFMQNLQRRLITKQRNYQGQYVRQTSTPGFSPSASGTDDAKEARLALPNDLTKISKAEVTIFNKDDAETPWYLYVNGILVTDFPAVTQAGTYDITPYVANAIDDTTQATYPYVAVQFKTS